MQYNVCLRFRVSACIDAASAEEAFHVLRDVVNTMPAMVHLMSVYATRCTHLDVECFDWDVDPCDTSLEGTNGE